MQKEIQPLSNDRRAQCLSLNGKSLEASIISIVKSESHLGHRLNMDHESLVKAVSDMLGHSLIHHGNS